MLKKPKQIIGWYEYADFPEWKIKKLKTKIDTGAKTSSLHVENIVFDRFLQVSFTVIQCAKDQTKRTRVRSVNVIRIARVKASPTQREKRIVVKTTIRLGKVSKQIEINLVDRTEMRFRMILGRTTLKGDFVVDVSKSNLLGMKKSL